MADKKKKGYEDAIRDMMDFVESQKSDTSAKTKLSPESQAAVAKFQKSQDERPFLDKVRDYAERIAKEQEPDNKKVAAVVRKVVEKLGGEQEKRPEMASVEKPAAQPEPEQAKRGAPWRMRPEGTWESTDGTTAPTGLPPGQYEKREDGSFMPVAPLKGRHALDPQTGKWVALPSADFSKGKITAPTQKHSSDTVDPEMPPEEGVLESVGKGIDKAGDAVFGKDAPQERLADPLDDARSEGGSRPGGVRGFLGDALLGATGRDDPSGPPPPKVPLHRGDDPSGPPPGTGPVKPDKRTFVEKVADKVATIIPPMQKPLDEVVAEGARNYGNNLVGEAKAIGNFFAPDPNDPATQIPPDERGTPVLDALGNAATSIGGVVNKPMQFVHAVSSPEGTVPDTLVQPRMASAVPPAAAPGSPATDPMAVPPSVSGRQSGSMSMGMKTKTPGVATPSGDWGDEAMKESLKQEKGAIAKQMKSEGVRLKQAAAVQQDAWNQALKLQADRTAAETRLAETMQKHEAGLNQLQQEVLEAGKAKINPGRYWANKDGGQKAAAVIAGALFGFTGQGMQWLQRLDGLVENDIKMQQADIANRRQSLEQATGMAQHAMAAAEKNGIRGIASVDAARAALYTNAKQQLEMQAAQAAASDPAMQARSMEMLAQLSEREAKWAQTSTQKQHADALDQEKIRQGWSEISMRKQAMEARAAGGGAGKGLKLPPAEQGQLARARAGLALLPELDKAVGSGKWPQAIGDAIAKRFPGTDANSRDAQAAFLNRSIFAGIDRSVINNADQKFLDEIQASPGLDALRKPAVLKALKRMLEATARSIQSTGAEMGQNVGEQLPEDDGIDFTGAQ